jgi:hypothetical protein
MKLTTLVLALALTPAWAQDIKFPPAFDKLAEKASEAVDVTLDGSLLQLAARFLSNRDPDEARVKQLVSGLKGIYVRAFEFDRDGEYSKADLDSIRNQLKAPTWQRMVHVRERGGENAEVYFRMEGSEPAGLLVIAAEERELVVVNIVGKINPEELSELGGHFGIPRLRDRKRDRDKEKDE